MTLLGLIFHVNALMSLKLSERTLKKNTKERNKVLVVMKKCFNFDELMLIFALSAAAPVPVQKPVEVTPPNRIQLLEADILQTPKTSATLLDDRTGTLFTQVSTVAETVISPQPVKDTATQDVIPKQRVYQFLQLLAKKVEKCQSIQDLFAVTAERRTRAIFSNYLVIVWAVQCKGKVRMLLQFAGLAKKNLAYQL